MKKSALLLAGLLMLLALPAHAAMIVNDHFDGGTTEFQNSWYTGISNAYRSYYHVQNSNLIMSGLDRGPKPYNKYYPTLSFYQQFDPVDDFEAEFKLSWWGTQSPRLGIFGLRLFDSDNDLVSGLYYYDFEQTMGQDYLRAGFEGTSHVSYLDFPTNGSGIGSIVRQDGILSFYWDDVLLTSTESLDQVTKLELFFQLPDLKLAYRYMTDMGVDYVTLEGDPDLSATPEPGTMVLLGSALGLGALIKRRRSKRNKQIQA